MNSPIIVSLTSNGTPYLRDPGVVLLAHTRFEASNELRDALVGIDPAFVRGFNGIVFASAVDTSTVAPCIMLQRGPRLEVWAPSHADLLADDWEIL